MAGKETRMLLLGAVAMFQPIDRHKLRGELVSWEIEEWAHIRPDLIFNALKRLRRDGLLAERSLVDAGRDVALFEVTDRGRTELARLMTNALAIVDPYDRVAFHIAFGMLPLLGRAQVEESLEARKRSLEETVESFPSPDDPDPDYGPPHAFRALMLWRESTVTELAWLEVTLRDIRSGAIPFEQDEDWGWVPPDDDPGWEMKEDREHYRSMLDR